MDRSCHLRFDEKIGEVFPPTVDRLKEMIKRQGEACEKHSG
jgi:hypothetical protein